MAAGKKRPETPDTDHSLHGKAGEQPARPPGSPPGLEGQTPEGLIHELQAHQAELEVQAEELRSAHLALGELRDRYLDLYEFAPVGYLTLTGNALITDANLTGAVLLGVERNNLVNTRFSEFIAGKDSDQWYRYFTGVLDQGKKQACTVTLIRGDGSTFPARLESIRIATSDGAIAVRVAISDITDIRRVEEALKERLKELNCLYGISALLELPGISLDEILNRTVLLLPPAWHFPEITEACIVLEGSAFQTARFRETSWMQAREIIVNGNPAGRVVVCYLEEQQVSGEGPFLKDERNLLNAIAERLGHIIERKRAEEALRGNDEKIRLLLNSAAEAIYGLDMNGNCTFCNTSCLRLLGYKHEDELLGRNMHWQIHAKHPDGTPYPVEECHIFRAFNKGEGTHVDDEVLWRADGTSFPAEYWSYPQRHNGMVVGAVVTFLDITERKRAELELAHLAAIVEYSDEAIIGKTLDGTITSWNAGAERTYGYSAQEVIGKNISLLVPPGHPDNTREILKKIGKGEAVIRYETLRRKKDGGQIDVLLTVSPVKDGQNRLIGVSTIVHDITGRKRMEEALRESNAYLNNLFDYANAPIIVWDTDYVITRFNHAFEDLTLLSEQEVTGQQLDLLFPKESKDRSLLAIKKTLGGERWEIVEIPILVKDGSVRTVLWNSANIIDPDGRIISTIAQGVDITDRKVADETLRETKDYLESLFTYANAPIIVWNPAFEITRFNHAFEELTGRTGQQVIGKHLEVLFPPESCDASMDLIQKALAGERWEIEEIPILNVISGEVRIVLWNSANILTTDGKTVLATIAQGQDITERKELENETKFHEQELMQFSTALATANKKLNLLSSITRHDINNQLTVQIGYLEILEDMPPGPDRDEYFMKVSTAAKRIAAMIKFTKEYEEIGVHASTWQDTRTLVDTAAKQAPLGMVVVKNDLPAGAEVFADPLVVKVFYNLMDNAVRYGGKITTIRFSAPESGDDQVIVCEDDGDGIAADEKVKIFERGFGKNTGLGLAISREILSITGITIRETGGPGKGARFEITVPEGARRFQFGKGPE